MALNDSTLPSLDGQADSTPEGQAIATGPGPKLTSLAPILQKLDTSLVFENKKYYIPSDLSPECWAKLRDYAATVEELAISNVESTIPDNTHVQWARHQGCAVLLSGLKKLHVTYKPAPPSSSFDISLFLSPSLSVLHIDHPSDEARLQLAFFLRGSPLLNLTRLSLQNLQPAPRLLNIIPSTCPILDTLELHITSGSLTYRQIFDFLALPFLQKLELSIQNYTTYEQEPTIEPSDAGTQAKLRHHPLSIQASGHPNFIIDVLRAAQCNSCSLTSASLDWKKWDLNNAKMSEILQQCPQDIQDLRLQGYGSIDFSEPLVSQQIVKFQSLKTLIFPLTSDLAQPNHWDTQLKSFLPLWVALEELTLPFGGGILYTVPGQSISLQSLKSIAEGCPSLRTLRACVQPPESYAGSQPTKFSSIILTHQLRNLTLASGLPQYKRGGVRNQANTALDFSTARYLYGLFPKLETIESSEDAWKPVVETVLVLKSVCNDVYTVYEQEIQKLKVEATH